MKHYFLTLIFLISLTTNVLGQETVSAESKKALGSNQLDSLSLSIKMNDIERIEKLFTKKEPNWFTTYGTMIVAIVALFGAVLTSILNNRRSRMNTQLQLDANRENIANQLAASQENLLAQIQANKTLEIEKKNLELEFKLKTELKENVAKFINKATLLNKKLIYIIYSKIEDGNNDEAFEEYKKTDMLRQEITDLFYSIKVTLDGSEKQRQLEEVLNNYMNVTCFEPDLYKMEKDQFEQPIGQLYHKIKSIIHDNYQVRINTSR